MLTTLLNFASSGTVLNLSGSILASSVGSAGVVTKTLLSGSVKNDLTGEAGVVTKTLLSAQTAATLREAAAAAGTIRSSAGALVQNKSQANPLFTTQLSAKTEIQNRLQAGFSGTLLLSARTSISDRAQAGSVSSSVLSARTLIQNKLQAGPLFTTQLLAKAEFQNKLLSGISGQILSFGKINLQTKALPGVVGRLPQSGSVEHSLRSQAATFPRTTLSAASKQQLTIRDNLVSASPLQSLATFTKLQLTLAANPVTNTPLTTLAGSGKFALRSGAGLFGRILLSEAIFFQAQQRLFASVQSGVLPAPKYIMTTSGTYVFNPPIGRLALLAFSRIGVHGTEVLQQHMENAWLETNLLQASWAADGITWWTVELVSVPLTQGTATYSVAQNIISVLDVYINNGSSNRLITPFSRTDYASLAEPTTQGFPTTFWFNRALSPTLTLWPVPDGNATYTMNYYAYTQTQDATIAGGGNAAIPYFWLDAYIADLAHRLSRIYAPALEAQRKQDMLDAYARANKQVEPSDLYITAGLQGYYRD